MVDPAGAAIGVDLVQEDDGRQPGMQPLNLRPRGLQRHRLAPRRQFPGQGDATDADHQQQRGGGDGDEVEGQRLHPRHDQPDAREMRHPGQRGQDGEGQQDPWPALAVPPQAFEGRRCVQQHIERRGDQDAGQQGFMEARHEAAGREPQQRRQGDQPGTRPGAAQPARTCPEQAAAEQEQGIGGGDPDRESCGPRHQAVQRQDPGRRGTQRSVAGPRRRGSRGGRGRARRRPAGPWRPARPGCRRRGGCRTRLSGFRPDTRPMQAAAQSCARAGAEATTSESTAAVPAAANSSVPCSTKRRPRSRVG